MRYYTFHLLSRDLVRNFDLTLNRANFCFNIIPAGKKQKSNGTDNGSEANGGRGIGNYEKGQNRG